MSLAETREARKERLLALRKRKAGEIAEENVDDSTRPVLRSRNFDPESRTLKKHALEDANMEDTVEKGIEGLAEKIIEEDEQRRAQELDVFNIAPKGPNWDLKRNLEMKLARLKRRDDEAIHTLIRQRLAAQKGQSDDIVGAMKAQERSQTNTEALSDDE